MTTAGGRDDAMDERAVAATGAAQERFELVIPTVGRPSLTLLLDALARCDGPRPERIAVVDDRPGEPDAPLPLPPATDVVVLRSGGRGPAAARNRGWRAGAAPWVVFLDDDVVPAPDWLTRLQDDLRGAGPRTGGVQGRIAVPLPRDRRPTDWERNVHGLERAQWATADLAYRRAALAQVGGFDERFRRNYREDADLGLRVVAAGWSIARGSRRIVHPAGPSGRWTSVRLQRGNGDDVLMRRLHGRDWRERAAAPPGRLPRHAATAAAGLAAVGSLAAGRRARRAAALAGAVWAAGTAELAWARIAPGPRTADELATMAATSVAMPFAATWWRLRGEWAWRGARPSRDAPPAAVLFDRDGTLVLDVPYNGDPRRVEPMPGAVDALAALRSAGVPTAVVSNQSGIARGLLTHDQVTAVNERVDRVLGGVGPWFYCPHGAGDGCACRKPQPGLVLAAARELGVAPERCVVIGDIGADVEAARAAGARGVLVPTERTLAQEVAAAPEVMPDLLSAVRLVLGARR
jgi:histidinol-phosphate phosphatase family protein